MICKEISTGRCLNPHSRDASESGAQTIPLDADNAIVFWDPTVGSDMETGKNSPAGVLVHEFVHAKNHLLSPLKFLETKAKKFEGIKNKNGPLKGVKIEDPKKVYDNEQELVTIEETNQILKKLPENSKRNSHRGSFFKTLGVTNTISFDKINTTPQDNTQTPSPTNK